MQAIKPRETLGRNIRRRRTRRVTRDWSGGDEGAVRTLLSPIVMRRPSSRVLYWAVVALLLLIVVAISVVPLYWAVTGAIKSPAELVRVPPSWLPQHPFWENYAQAWSRYSLGSGFANSAILAVGAWLFHITLNTGCAYALSKLRPVGGRYIYFLILTVLFVPSTSSAFLIPAYATVADLPILHVSLINNYLGYWLPTANSAFNVFILKRFFDRVPQDIVDAATLDGAGPLRTALYIVAPLSRAILVVISITSLIAAWKDFLWPLLVLSDQSKWPVMVLLYNLQSSAPLSMQLAGYVLAAVPTFLVFMFLQRYILVGLVAFSDTEG